MAAPRRRDRLSEFLRKEVAQIVLVELADPRLEGVAVTRAEVSDDIQNARVYVRVMGTAADQRTAMRALEHATGMIQSEVASRMETRYTPRLKFFLDEEVEKERRLFQLLDKVNEERGESEPVPDSDSESE